MNKSSGPSQSSQKNLLEQYHNKQFKEAEELAISLITKFPIHTFGWKVLGAILGATNRKIEALEIFKKVAELDPLDQAGLFNLSIVLQELNMLEESENWTRKLLSINPNQAEAHFNLGLILEEFGEFNESLVSFKKAISLKPNWPEAYYNLGNIFRKQSNFEESVSSYQRAIELKPDYSEAYNNLGNSFKLLNKLNDAKDSYALAIKLNPLYSEARKNLNNLTESLIPAWHIKMMNDQSRNQAYFDAIKIAVNQGDAVLEVGTGSGILSMMAAQCGAEIVTSCETSIDIANVAKKIISQNQYESQINVVNKKSTDLILGKDIPKKVDLLISEILSAGFVGEGVRPIILDAKNRFLKEDGKIIPEMGEVKIALVGESNEISDLVLTSGFDEFDLSKFNSITQSEFSLHLKEKPNYLSNSTSAFSINLNDSKKIKKEEKIIRLKATRSGICLGILQWLNIQIFKNISYENKPGEVSSHWPTPFYKFEQPIKVEVGDVLEINSFLAEDDIFFYKL